MKTYKALTVSALLINNAIGTGILNLPKTVAKASIFISLILLTILSFFGYLVGQYNLDALTRTFAIERYRKYKEGQQKQIEIVFNQSETEEYTPDFSLPNDYTYEMAELCKIYYGQIGFYIYQIAVSLYIFGLIWGYTSVVAQSLSSVIPFGPNWHCGDPCGGNYASLCNVSFFVWAYLAVIYASIFVFVNMANQKIFQNIYIICRFLAVGGFAIVAFAAIFISPFDIGTDVSTSFPYVKKIPLFKFEIRSFGSMVSSSVFAIILHYCIPGAMQPVCKDQQHLLNAQFIGSFAFIYLIMAFVAYPSALYFGTDGSQLITLNLINWDGKSWNAEKQPVWAAIIAYTIRVLPPIYVIGAMPLKGLALSGNLMSLAPKLRSRKWFQIFTKLISIVPAGFLAGFFRCIGQIISLTGLCGFVILMSPAFCLIKARRQCNQLFGDTKSPFSVIFDPEWLIITILVIFIITFGVTVYAVISNVVSP